jgi:hypothetical protein
VSLGRYQSKAVSLGRYMAGLRWAHHPKIDLANEWRLPRRHVSSPSMNSPTLRMNGPTLKKSVGIARCARLINKKRVRGKVPGRLGRFAEEQTSPKGRQPFGVTPSRHLLARILAPWRIEHTLNFGKTHIFSAARTTSCSHKSQQA